MMEGGGSGCVARLHENREREKSWQEKRVQGGGE